MSKSFIINENKKIDINQLWNKVKELQIDSIKSIMLSPIGPMVTLFDDKEISDEDKARLENCIKSYEYYPTADDIRRDRKPLLEEVDWRINRAQDNNEDTSLLVSYRKALRDITKEADKGPVTWPTKPW